MSERDQDDALMAQQALAESGIKLSPEDSLRIIDRFEELIEEFNAQDNPPSVVSDEVRREVAAMPLRTITNRAYREMVARLLPDNDGELDPDAFTRILSEEIFHYTTADLSSEQIDKFQAFICSERFANVGKEITHGMADVGMQAFTAAHSVT